MSPTVESPVQPRGFPWKRALERGLLIGAGVGVAVIAAQTLFWGWLLVHLELMKPEHTRTFPDVITPPFFFLLQLVPAFVVGAAAGLCVASIVGGTATAVARLRRVSRPAE